MVLIIFAISKNHPSWFFDRLAGHLVDNFILKACKTDCLVVPFNKRALSFLCNKQYANAHLDKYHRRLVLGLLMSISSVQILHIHTPQFPLFLALGGYVTFHGRVQVFPPSHVNNEHSLIFFKSQPSCRLCEGSPPLGAMSNSPMSTKDGKGRSWFYIFGQHYTKCTCLNGTQFYSERYCLLLIGNSPNINSPGPWH